MVNVAKYTSPMDAISYVKPFNIIPISWDAKLFRIFTCHEGAFWHPNLYIIVICPKEHLSHLSNIDCLSKHHHSPYNFSTPV